MGGPDEVTASFEFTVEVDRNSFAFDLLMFGMTRAQHDLLRRLNIRWKYRIDPGTPEDARRYFGGTEDRSGTLTPVIVTVDGRDIEALAEVRPGNTTFYPAHPKGKP